MYDQVPLWPWGVTLTVQCHLGLLCSKVLLRHCAGGRFGAIWPGAKGRLWRSLRGGDSTWKVPSEGLGWLCHLDVTKEPLLKAPALWALLRTPGLQGSCVYMRTATPGLGSATPGATGPMWSVHTMEYCPALKRNDIQAHATTWTHLGDIMLSEIRHSQKVRYCVIPLM